MLRFTHIPLYPVSDISTFFSRLALLYSTATFVSIEAFRRAALGVTDRSKWRQAINLAWLRYASVSMIATQ